MQRRQRGTQRGAREWRERRGLIRDDGLAYAFESYEDAQVAGGQTLAGQWVTARSKAQEELLPAAAAAVEAAASSRAAPTSFAQAEALFPAGRGDSIWTGLCASDKVVRRVPSKRWG